MVFPGAGPLSRHPSQIYEAALEGFILFLVLIFAIRRGALQKPGFVAGLFAFGYAVARIFCEFFKEPDPELLNLPFGLTMGTMLSIPMLITAALVIARARTNPQ